jgi:hypothetical protein
LIFRSASAEGLREFRLCSLSLVSGLLLKLGDHSFDAPTYAKLIKMKTAKPMSPVIAAAQDQRRIANEPRRS